MSEPTTIGTYSVDVVVHGDSKTLLAQTKLNVKNALKAMADATLQRAQMLAPMSAIEGHAGTLRASGLVAESSDGLTVAVRFGNGIPYARYQEFGGDGVRVVKNYTTEGTQAHYLRDAGNSVAKEGLKQYL